MLVVTCELWERDLERTEERIIKGQGTQGIFWCVGQIHYLACDDGFSDTYT